MRWWQWQQRWGRWCGGRGGSRRSSDGGDVGGCGSGSGVNRRLCASATTADVTIATTTAAAATTTIRAKDAGTACPLIAENNSRSSSSECEVEDSDPDENVSTHNLANFISTHGNDSVTLKREFLKQYPVQIHHVQGENRLFEPSNCYYRTLYSGEKVQMKRLLYSFQLNKLFCSTCMACIGKENREFRFISGHEISYKHINKAVEIHENSKYHQNSVTAELQLCKQGDFKSLLYNSQATYIEKQIETSRLILQHLIDITLFIGRQGLAYRRKEEASYSLNQIGNHGNFLELVLLISEYDVILKTHVEQCIEDRKKRMKDLKKREVMGNRKKHFCKGSLVIFLSKTSLIIDSTQYIATMDQLAICIRYVVQGNVYERLLDLCVFEDSSGQAQFEGCYNGLRAQLKKDNPSIIHTHCMAHVLNMVMADSTVNCLNAENLFGLVEETACFLSHSYKRMTAKIGFKLSKLLLDTLNDKFSFAGLGVDDHGICINSQINIP
ncbi:hypothetical protein PR048_005503, partial [Dryococelus australis]